jgi:DNA-binding XRE family transcriptional regulator
MNKHVDTHVGRQLRTLRQLRGLSQTALGEAVGVTFQQIQKYETGANRISAGYLYQFANLLGVQVTYFFEGLQVGGAGRDEQDPHGYGMVLTTDHCRLLDSYNRIKSTKTKKKLADLIASMSEEPGFCQGVRFTRLPVQADYHRITKK